MSLSISVTASLSAAHKTKITRVLNQSGISGDLAATLFFHFDQALEAAYAAGRQDLLLQIELLPLPGDRK